MKKMVKTHSSLFNKDVTITIDESLNKLKGKILAPKKLAQANKQLKKMKTLPR